jgi:hypothetical protein
MADNEKLKKIMDLFNGLSEQEKSDFATELSEDEDLMARLLSILMNRNEAELQTDATETGTFVDFLRRFKE